MKESNPSVVGTTEVRSSSDEEKAVCTTPVDSLPAQQWPTEPVPLERDWKSSVLMALYDAVLILIPIILMVKIGLVILAWKQDEYHRGTAVDLVGGLTTFLIEFNGQMVTAFTIVFVTIISTLVRRYALWKAQKGAYISELEQLQGSISLPSTIKLIWSLRAFTTTSLSLLAIWSFYYLGSQASKLEFRLVNSVPFYNQNVAVSAPDFPSTFYNDSDVFWNRMDMQDTNAALISALGYKAGALYKPGTDLNGNPVVPDIKAILSAEPGLYSKSTPDPSGWVNVERQSELELQGAYTSLVGSPVLVLDNSSALRILTSPQTLGEYEFTANYFDIGCDLPTKHAYDAFPNTTTPGSLVSFKMMPASNATKDSHGNPLRYFEYYVRWTANDETQTVPSNASARMLCNITSISVEVRSHCVVGGCFPRFIRYEKGSSLQDATKYSTPFDNADFAAKFFGNFSSTRLASDLDGIYLALQMADYNDQESLNVIAATVSSPRMKRFLNTYYTLSQQNLNWSPSSNFFLGESDPLFVLTKLHGAPFDPHYAIYWPWIAMDGVSCVILLVAAIISVLLRQKTLVPDIFGYVSSLTRDNPNLKGALPDSGTGLDGIERARMLNKVKVKIGDVSGDDTNVARVGLAMVTTSTGTASGVSNSGNAPRIRVEPLKPGMAVV